MGGEVQAFAKNGPLHPNCCMASTTSLVDAVTPFGSMILIVMGNQVMYTSSSNSEGV